MRTTKVAAAGAVAALALVGCGNGNDERLRFLNEVSRIGADTHASVAAPDGTVDQKDCEKAFEGRIVDIPSAGIPKRDEWHAEVRRTFVAACLSGRAAEINMKAGD
ncbi:hypothetical protein [Micromonospora chalcea]|uniref:hypothetical protein n=1 Tax=Micromonospora chalcea TaxID=1874 RepID=UPI003D747CAC